MDCIILAGGLGTRLRSVISEVPKCMAPVAGKPFLFYILKYLSGYDNINRVILSVGYLREHIFDWLEKNKKGFSFGFDFSIEEMLLGTGGGIRLAMNKTESESVLILNGDTFFNIDLALFCRQHKSVVATLSVALKPMQDFDRYGNVVLNDNKITAFKEKEFCVKGLINGGVYIINKTNSFFDDLPEKFSFETEILQPAAKDNLIHGFVFDNYFIDIGIPEDYKRADKEFRTLFV
jgi:D-glycero-alpha-D-manno-heptose 1-phosphate guanylyltransferase